MSNDIERVIVCRLSCGFSKEKRKTNNLIPTQTFAPYAPNMPSPVSDSLIDMAPLQRVIDRLIAMSLAILEGALDKPALAKLKALSAQIERVSKELRRGSVWNLRAQALARLRSDKAYRARIRFELGGHHVIARWKEKLRGSNFPRQIELRAKRAEYLQQMKSGPDEDYERGLNAAKLAVTPRRPARQKRPALRQRKAVRTDSSGLFRLAPVPLWLSTHIVRPQAKGQGARGPRAETPRRLCAPIALMPDDLLADDVVPDEFERDDFKAPPSFAVMGIEEAGRGDAGPELEEISLEGLGAWRWPKPPEDAFGEPLDKPLDKPPPRPMPPRLLPLRVL